MYFKKIIHFYIIVKIVKCLKNNILKTQLFG
jgi:hypothetical protein